MSSNSATSGTDNRPIAIRRALISVYDKTGIVDFARALHDEFGVEIISTGGTAKTLSEAGIPVTLVEDITGFPEMLDGRVKTLHPRIHAAILADRDNPEHMRQLAEQGIEPIDMVVVNLYPFEKTIAKPDCSFEEAIEMIDIGGPCLLRAAAKSANGVLVVPGATYFRRTLRYLHGDTRSTGSNWPEFLRTKAFQTTAAYEIVVHNYFGQQYWQTPFLPALMLDLTLDTPTTGNELCYGENPHQRGSVYCSKYGGLEVGGGAEGDTSFNNFADASAALELCAELTQATLGKVWHRLIAGAHKPRTKSAAALEPIDDETYTRRNLPHIQRPGATYFVTFRSKTGEFTDEERDLIMECCIYQDGKLMSLQAVVVMPDHVHLLLTPTETSPGKFASLSKILHSIKGVSGRRVAKHRGRQGSVWLDESWDRIVRDEEEFWLRMDYIHENPSRAGAELERPYPWCAFEREANWDASARAAGVGGSHVLIPGQQLAGLSVGRRDWHRLLAGATHAGATHVGVTLDGSSIVDSNKAELCSPLACCFIKHTNACGTAVDEDPIEAYRRAYLGDPNAAMGGILAVNFEVDAAFAAAVMETYQRWGKPLKEAGHPPPPGAFFLEVWVAPSFDEEAVRIIRGEKEGGPQKAWGKRVRLLEVGDMSVEPDADEMDIKRIAGGVLMQTRDLLGLNEDQWKVVSKRTPSEAEMNDLRLAWLVCKHTKSNAISICKDGMLIGNGAGQMSRVMSCRIATWLAKENGHADALDGAVAASDAFFPFRDGPEILIDAGITAVIQPGGSKRDEDTIAACDERDVAMIFTGTRHFRH